jgi:hypothetical protein
LAGSKKQAALLAAGLAESESAGKIACPTNGAFSWGFAGRRPIPTESKNQPNPLKIRERQELKIRRLVGQVGDLPHEAWH